MYLYTTRTYLVGRAWLQQWSQQWYLRRGTRVDSSKPSSRWADVPAQTASTPSCSTEASERSTLAPEVWPSSWAGIPGLFSLLAKTVARTLPRLVSGDEFQCQSPWVGRRGKGLGNGWGTSLHSPVTTVVNEIYYLMKHVLYSNKENSDFWGRNRGKWKGR